MRPFRGFEREALGRFLFSRKFFMEFSVFPLTFDYNLDIIIRRSKNTIFYGEMSELVEGARLEIVKAVKAASGVRIPISPPRRSKACFAPFFFARKTSDRFLAPPLSQKVTLGLPVRL